MRSSFSRRQTLVPEFHNQLHLLLEWKTIAARDATMTIYHFGQTLDAIVKSIRTCPPLKAGVLKPELDSAQPLFEKLFQKSTRMRNAVGHDVDRVATPKKMQDDTFKGDLASIAPFFEGSGSLFIGQMLVGRELTMTKKSDVVSVEVSEAKLGALAQIRDLVYRAVEPLARSPFFGRSSSANRKLGC